MFQITLHQDLQPWLDDSASWDSLSRGVPFRETAWLRPWWMHFGEPGKGYLLAAHDAEGTLRGLLPLYRTPSNTGGRSLGILGDGEACSDHVSVLVREEDQASVGEAMGRFLAAKAADPVEGWDTIDFDGVVEGDIAIAALASGLRSGGASLHTQSRMRLWFKPTDASWDDHLKHYGKTQRRRMRRMTEKISEGGIVDKQVASTEQEVDQLLSALIEMHQTRWTQVGQPGSFANATFRAFMFNTAKEFLRRDRLYLNVLSHQGKQIGAEISLIGEDRILYCYSAGYDTEAADLEPGRLVGIDTMLHLYRKNLAGIDYMRGDEEYKQRLSQSSRRVFQIRVVSPHWLPRLRHAAWSTGFELKNWIRRRAGRSPIEVVEIADMQSEATSDDLNRAKSPSHSLTP